MNQSRLLEVYQSGQLTVIGFWGHDFLDHVSVHDCQSELADLVRSADTKTLACDLTGIKVLPSGMLGVLASMRKLGLEVYLFNPTDDVREVLEITQLDQVFHIETVDV